MNYYVKICVYLTGHYMSVGSKGLIELLNKQTNIIFILWKYIRMGAIDGNPLGTGKTTIYLYSKNTVLGMPDGRFSIINEKPFSNSICKSACIQFIFSGGDAPYVLDLMQIWSNKPPISPFWVLCLSQFLNGWALPKSSINNDARNRPFWLPHDHNGFPNLHDSIRYTSYEKL